MKKHPSFEATTEASVSAGSKAPSAVSPASSAGSLPEFLTVRDGGRTYIWTSKRESGLYDVGAFRNRYYRAIQMVPGVRRLSPHCCRHTFISNLEREGVPMEQIARIVGHSKVDTTDGYLHVSDETLEKAVSVLNRSKGK